MHAKTLLYLTGLLFLSACGNFTSTVKTGKPQPQLSQATDKIEFYWVGHATVLMRIYDKWIITDPNFSMRTGTVRVSALAVG